MNLDAFDRAPDGVSTAPLPQGTAQPGAGAVRRILIIKWSALGDVAIATAAMDDIRRAYPDATIHLNTLPSAARLFEADPRFDELVVVDVRARTQRWRRNLEWLRRVRRARYDLVVDLQRSDHTRLLLALLLLGGHRIRQRIGARGGFPYTVRPSLRDPAAHAYAQMRSALHAAGIGPGRAQPVLHPPAHARAHARQVLAEAGLAAQRFALLLPGSQAGGWLKRWGAERYAALALLLLGEGAVAKIAVAGGPEEIDECTRIVQAINARRAGAAVHLDRLPLLEIPEVAAAAELVVANDTGTAHVAAAAGRPMLVVCGPTDPRRVMPVGADVRAVQATLPCINCYAKRCPIAAQAPCMAAITPEGLAGLLLRGESPGTGVRLFGPAETFDAVTRGRAA